MKVSRPGPLRKAVLTQLDLRILFSIGLLLLCGASGVPVEAVQAQQEPSGATVLLAMQWEGAPPAPSGPWTVALSSLAAGASENHLELEVDPARGPSSIPVPAGLWQVQVREMGLWSPPLTVLAREQESVRAKLRIWPARTLEVPLKPSPEIPLPRRLQARFRPATDGVSPPQDHPAGSVECSLDRSAALASCRLPADRLDLLVQPQGYIGKAYWGVELTQSPKATGAASSARNHEIRLSPLELRLGASVRGWLLTAEGESLPQDARVALAPVGARAAQVETGTQPLTLQPAKPGAGGFFQLDGVPPGRLLLQASAQGYAPLSTMIELAANEQLELSEPLLLAPPVTFQVFVHPASDGHGQPWSLWIARISAGLSRLAESRAVAVSLDGRAEISELTPGTYFVRLLDDQGENWLSREVQIVDGAAPLELSLDLVRVEGTLSLGEKPLAARVAFGGRLRAERIGAEADAEGSFSLILPESGDWPVEVQSAEPPVRRFLGRVKVEDPDGEGAAKVALELPATRLPVRVVDEEDRPVSQALVEVVAPQLPMEAVQQPVDSEGRAVFEGLEEGAVQVRASGRESESETRMVWLQEGLDPPPVRLVLARQRFVVGQVVSELGPVAGALVQVEPVGRPGRPVGGSMTTGEDGRFRLSVPVDSKQAVLRVGAVGWSLRTLRIDLDARETWSVPLHRLRGSLSLHLGALPELAAPAFVPVLLTENGYLGLSILRSWAASVAGPALNLGEVWRIPDLEPGDYRLCRLTVGEALAGAAMQPGAVPAERCDEGWLAPYGELELTLPGA